MVKFWFFLIVFFRVVGFLGKCFVFLVVRGDILNKGIIFVLIVILILYFLGFYGF